MFKLSDSSKVRGYFVLHKQTRQILSLSFDYWIKADLVTTTMDRIDFNYDGSIWHTNQGKQYEAGTRLEIILVKVFIASMSRADKPVDNVMQKDLLVF